MDTDRLYLPNSRECFVCGEENHAGLKARFYVEEDMVKMPLSPQAHHCGYENTVHGGVIAAALDECMGWAVARKVKRLCVTGELTVRYLKRVPTDRALTVHAEAAKVHRLMSHARAELVDEEGTVYAKGEARFLPLSEDETRAVDGFLQYDEHTERLFE